jgi:orotidine-5'-phosphate decarboxylase
VRNFMELLNAKWAENKFVCVGLDSDVEKLPMRHLANSEQEVTKFLAAQEHYVRIKYAKPDEEVEPLSQRECRILARAQLAFNKRIVDATAVIACAYKPNSAFYEPLGDWGMWSLKETMLYIRAVASEIPVILDFKRGDIGNTNIGYVMAAFLADAYTVNPYFGVKAMKPFLDQKNKGVIILVRTSNPGAGEFQDLKVHQGIYHDDSCEAIYGPLYQRVARNVVGSWNYNNNCCVVAGATRPDEVKKVREIVGDKVPILGPGFGKQAADIELAVKAALNKQRQGLIANNSSAVIFASEDADFDKAACFAALKMHVAINTIRESI